MFERLAIYGPGTPGRCADTRDWFKPIEPPSKRRGGALACGVQTRHFTFFGPRRPLTNPYPLIYA